MDGTTNFSQTPLAQPGQETSRSDSKSIDAALGSDDQEKQAPRLHVRLASSLADLEYLRPVSLEFHKESRFADIPYSHKKRDDLMIKALNNSERYALMIAEYKGEPIGFLFCTAGEYLVGYGELMTTVYSFYVRKKYRGSLVGGRAAVRLLKGAVKWSQLRNAREIMIHVTSGIDIKRTDKFLRRGGFGVIGANYSLPLRRPGSPA